MPGLSRDEKRREIERGALRHYGRKYAFWIVFGPFIAKGLLWVALVGLAWLTWVKVPHVVLGVAALAIALGSATALVMTAPSLVGTRRRMLAAASGVAHPRMNLGWAYATLLVVGVGMGWLALWSPFS